MIRPGRCKKIVFLSADEVVSRAADDLLMLEPLAKREVEVDVRSWKTIDNWSDFDAAVIRSTWDYPAATERFLDVLRKATVPLYNRAETVAWNHNKSYLNRYRQWTLPTHFHRGDEMTPELLSDYRREYGEIVVKPAVGLGGYDTVILRGEQCEMFASSPERLWMIQPLATSIRTEGELSLVYFEKIYSHAVLKRAQGEEFRIHEHFGGSIEAARPDREAFELSEQVLAAVEDELLYARVDLVKFQGSWKLMELEAIEPSLYLEFDPLAPERFAEALVQRLRNEPSVV